MIADSTVFKKTDIVNDALYTKILYIYLQTVLIFKQCQGVNTSPVDLQGATSSLKIIDQRCVKQTKKTALSAIILIIIFKEPQAL